MEEDYTDQDQGVGDDMYYSEEDFDMYQDDLRMSITDLFHQCVIPTMQQTATFLGPLLGFCFIFRISCILYVKNEKGEETGIPRFLLHFTSAICGFLALHLFFPDNHLYIYLLISAVLSYVTLALTKTLQSRYTGVIVAVVSVLYVLACEIFIVDSKDWHKIRGAQMVLTMKIISVGFDVNDSSVKCPSFHEFMGYCFNVGTVIFGPWISFHDYKYSLEDTNKKINLPWVIRIAKSLVLALLCMVWSTCLLHWLFTDDMGRWPVSYRDAQSYRFSHYFVSFTSEVTAILSGIGSKNILWNMSVSQPHHIEIPRSLVQVVTHWNLPMHYWLKTYIFKAARPLGTFVAILLTYGASALLHGLNFQLAAVLFSLGFYSYVEYVLRKKLSNIFNACILAKRCKDCNHSHNDENFYVRVVNFVFGVLTIFHLTYLGLMFDSSSEQVKGYTMEHTLKKWYDLGFVSHLIICATYSFQLLI